MRDASDEERQLLQAEMQIEMAKAQADAEAKVKDIIGEDKLKRLRQISYHRQGVSAVSQDSVSKELGLSAAQLEQIEQYARRAPKHYRNLHQACLAQVRDELKALDAPQRQNA